MLVNFGSGKCPLCGDFGEKVDKKMFHCRRCDIRFNEFFIASFKELREASKYWN